jgi:group I intron endonuclease
MISGVYLIRNMVNGRVYIGSSKNIAMRLRYHRSGLRGGHHRNAILQAAWLKYGEAAFEFAPLMYCPTEVMLQNEQWAIEAYSAHYISGGYNICPNARAPVGIKRSEETKAKFRLFANSPDGREVKRRAAEVRWAAFGAVEEARAKALGKKHTEASRAKMRAAYSSPEAREKKRQAALIRWANAGASPA